MAQTAPKKIKVAAQMKQLMADHFHGVDAASRDPDKRVAWCTSVGPAELLRAMDFEVYFPENHAAMLGATRMATDFIAAANARGYSPDICSYLTADIGSYLNQNTPLTRAYEIPSVPKPDVLVYNTNQCRDVKDWFSFYSREWDVPLLGVETYRGVDEVTHSHIKGVSGQLRALVSPLEEVAGHRLDEAKFEETVALSRRCSELWKAVLDTGGQRPSPLTFFDGTIHMGPAVVLRGTQQAVEYYELLLAELRQRIQEGVAAVEDERFRIYWEGMPVWGKLRDLSNWFLELNTCVNASTYCNSWIFEALDPQDPFDSMARAYTELFIVRADTVKEEYIAKMVKFFGADGVIYHNAKTCPNNSNCRYGMPQRLQQRLDVPFLILDGDLNDLRCFSEEQAHTNIEAFVEQLAETRG
jgi:benzoyl-CoA reductase/2-hydroxyglutaryl-CoA dehydratase subunit BcrC/BadD/HgdB